MNKSFPISSIFVLSFFLLFCTVKNETATWLSHWRRRKPKLGSQLRRLFLSRLDCQSCHQLTCFLSCFLTYTSTMHQYILYVHSSTEWCTSTEKGGGGGVQQRHWLAWDINSVQIHWFYFTFTNFLPPFWIGFIPFGLTLSAAPAPAPGPHPPAPSHSVPPPSHSHTHAPCARTHTHLRGAFVTLLALVLVIQSS